MQENLEETFFGGEGGAKRLFFQGSHNLLHNKIKYISRAISQKCFGFRFDSPLALN